MGKYGILFTLGLSIYTAYVLFIVFSDDAIPVLPDRYWGPKSKEGQKEDTSIRSFKINVDEKVLHDLKARIKFELSAEGNRLTLPLDGTGFTYGFNHIYLRNIAEYWLEKYDWRQREKVLNKFPQFKTQISGIDIHFLHLKSSNNQKYKKTRPLLLLHGWPGSFVLLQKIIPFLTDPKDSDINFEVVIPTLPGYGFSEPARQPGLGDIQVAQIFLKLMQRLGYNRFYAHGGDLGSTMLTHMSSLYHKNVMGIHSTNCVSNHPRGYVRLLVASLIPQLFMSSKQASRLSPISKYIGNILKETSHIHAQAAKPDTISIGLANSPTGFAAYILDKFSSLTNAEWIAKDDGGLPYYNLDDLLDNIMIYWVNNAITTSFRLHSESFNVNNHGIGLSKVPTYVPTACLNMPDELFSVPEFVLGDKYPQIIRFTTAERGGHFASFQVPELVAKDIITFFNHMENSGLALFEKKL